MAAEKPEPTPFCRNMPGVMGLLDFRNDMLACGSIVEAKQHVLYFGGDVQDDKEKMMIFNPEYVEWSLQDTAILLQRRFPKSVVFVVKPSEMYLYTFSLYKNFLKFDEDGRPEFSGTFGAWHHLVKLYKNVLEKCVELEKCEMSQNACESLPGNDVPVHIVGFSKGCVVLNQLTFELKQSKKSTEVQKFLKQVKSFNWLDGGHIGGKNAYITDDDVLWELVSLDKDIIVHVTPYQIRDPTRQWIGKEEEECVDKLKKLNAKVEEFRHFMNEKGSIQNHFKVLTKI